MKKLLALALAFVLLLPLAACGGTPGTSSGGESSPAPSAAPPAPTPAPEIKTYRVAMICDSYISDGGWGAACYNAMLDAAAAYGWETDYIDGVDPAAYYEAILPFCEQGFDLIYAPGNQYTDAVLKAAEEYPDIAFALLNGGTDTPAQAANSNVSSLLPNATQIGWIAGAMAGLMTETGVIAFIGGMELATTKEKYEAYKTAAAYVAEQAGKTAAALDIVYSNSFSAMDKGAEFAREMMEQGADVFFGDASAVDSGARQAIDEANAAAGSVKVYDIAQPSDALGQNECIITSQVTDNASLVALSMDAVEAGTFGGEVIYGTLQNGTLSAGRISELVPPEIQTAYRDYLEQMTANKFMK